MSLSQAAWLLIPAAIFLATWGVIEAADRLRKAGSLVDRLADPAATDLPTVAEFVRAKSPWRDAQPPAGKGRFESGRPLQEDER